MKAPTSSRVEAQRLSALQDYAVLDTAAEPSFDALTRLAAEILEVPIALISLVDVDRQWFKSRYGLDAPQTSREVSFCGHVVASENALVVPDALLDDRFSDNPLVTGDPHVRFYAGMPLLTPDGYVLGTLCAIDHRERRVSERQLSMLNLLARQVVELLELRRHSRLLRQFKVTLDGTRDGIFIFDPETLRFSYANRGAITQSGFSLAELQGKTPLDLKSRFDEAGYRRLLEPLLNGDKSEVLFETTHRHKRGNEIPVEVLLQYMAPEGEPARFINVVRDISERKRLDELKSQFVSTVSHELRTPLTSIRGSLGLVAAGVTGLLPAQAKEYVDVALANTDRLMRLINDMLDTEKAESQRLEFRLAPVSASSLAQAAVRFHQAFARSLEIELLLVGDAPCPDVLGDADRIAQVLTNLISNALKFSRPGQRVEVAVERHDGGAHVQVCDHGTGVPEDFRPRIFERFAQADGSDGRSGAGSGLGLSICKALVRGMNGEIGYFETEGGGATFFFDLPFATSDDSARLPAPSRNAHDTG